MLKCDINAKNMENTRSILTVVYTLFVGSTISHYIHDSASGFKHTNQNITYNQITIRILSYASMIIFSFMLTIPMLIYGVCKYYSSVSVRLFDLLMIYGYGMSVWVLVSV